MNSKRAAIVGAILCSLAVLFIVWGITLSRQADHAAYTTGSSTRGKEPGSIQERQPSKPGGQRKAPLNESNVPPAGQTQ